VRSFNHLPRKLKKRVKKLDAVMRARMKAETPAVVAMLNTPSPLMRVLAEKAK
jgi:hypothetical protein